jgi:DNA-binding NtrC family response regulator
MRSSVKDIHPTGVIGSGQSVGMKTVLVVDDDTAFLRSLAEMIALIDPAYDVMTAENGEQALAVLRTIPVDLLITDIRMPVIAGSELVLWVKENMPRIPVIAMSAGNENALAASIGGEGYQFYDKPLDVTDFARTIKTLLQSKEKA